MRGSVQKDKERGTWFFVVDNGIDPSTGNRRRVRRRGFRTKKLAENALRDFFAESATGEYVEPSGQPLRTFLDGWLASVELKKKASTAAMYRHKMSRYVYPRIGAIPLRAVEPETLDALYVELLRSGGRPDQDGNPTALSESTVAVVHRILHKALAHAVERNLLRYNPASSATVPQSSAPRDERDTRAAWSAAELRRFLDHVADDRLAALWTVAATTGMRRGELCGLRWADVNLDAGSLEVRRSRVPISGRIIEETPKSGRERTIALASATVAALRAHRRRQLEDRLAWGEAWADTGYVFTYENGQPLRPDAVTRVFKEHVAAAGVRPAVVHTLRHTFVTLGLANGVPVKVMQEAAGHAKVETTLGYAHVLDGQQQEAAKTLERAIFGQ